MVPSAAIASIPAPRSAMQAGGRIVGHGGLGREDVVAVEPGERDRGRHEHTQRHHPGRGPVEGAAARARGRVGQVGRVGRAR